MKFSDAEKILALIPYTSPSKGKIFYDHIMKYKPKKCLELGFAHGTSACYIAAALDELGEGHLTAVDLIKSKNEKPNFEELLEKTNLHKYISIKREVNSYNWFLNKEIGKNSDKNFNCEPLYDFIFIDGPKDWTIDGLAFFLSDKLLKKDGWIVFDDYLWCDYVDNYGVQNGEVPNLDYSSQSEDQNKKPNVKEVFEKLVMQHSDYANFNVQDNILAWAQKKGNNKARHLSFTSGASFKYKFLHTLKKLIGRKY